MKIELDTENTGSNKIISYSDDEFRLKDKHINSNLVISRDFITENWLEEGINNLASHHLESIINNKPEILILGTGKKQIFPQQDIYALLMANKIGFEVMDTGAACRSYNLLTDEGRNVIACLMLPGR